MYKRKRKKIYPANVSLQDGIKPEGGVNQGNGVEVPKELTVVPCGSRLTSKRLAKMKIGDGLLMETE
jgi:hypothetical protein